MGGVGGGGSAPPSFPKVNKENSVLMCVRFRFLSGGDARTCTLVGGLILSFLFLSFFEHEDYDYLVKWLLSSNLTAYFYLGHE